MVYSFFNKNSQGSGLANNKENIQLAGKLHKAIIRKSKKERYILYLKTIFGV